MMRRTLAVAIASVILSACGGSGSVSTPAPAPTPAPEPTLPDINAATAISGNLVQPGADSFEQYYKNGIFGSNYNNITREGEPHPTAPTFDGGVTEFASSDTGGFSQTNTAEVGVDEADRIEYNGSHLFIATQPVWNGTEAPAATVRVMARNEDFSLTEVSNVVIDENNSNINGMYLQGDRLSVVSSGYPIMTLVDVASTSLFAPEGGFQNSVDVKLLDTSVPAQTSVVADIAIDGWLVASRRIDDYLYLVSSYNPYVEMPHAFPENDEQRLENYLFIQDLNMADLMPSISVNDASSTMNTPDDCFIPEQATAADGYNSLLTITRINMTQVEDISSICMSAYADNSYMSTDSLYLSAHVDNGQAIHKIDLGEQFTYAASGNVRGYLWGRDGKPQLRMSENDGYFRIVTSERGENGPEHRLTVMQQDGNSLRTVAELPNAEQPTAIGKPNEDIFAVRFIQDRAYIVTFERIDPLYVIDLSDNTTPFVAGELEIPGFSSYLHPMDNGYLLGIGQEVDQQSIPGTGEEPTILPVTSGMKVSLFDVSDPANPQEVSNISYQDTYTPAEYDYRALSVLQTGDTYQFAMPTERWVATEQPAPVDPEDTPTDETGEGDGDTTSTDEPVEPAITIWQPENSLLMLEVNAASGAGEMNVINQMAVENDPESYVWGGEDRSVIHGENVFYIHGNQVWHSLWAKDAAVNGPY